MPDFTFKARSATGDLLDGCVSAPDRAGAIHLVELRGAIPILITPASGTTSPVITRPVALEAEREAPLEQPGRLTLSHQQRHLFTEQLAHLLEAGMTLDESLAVLTQRLKQPRLQQLARRLHRALIEGRSLSEALREYPGIFSSLYTNLVSAGEASGALPLILQRLVVHLADIKALRDRVQQALLYPAVLVVAGFGLILTFMTVMVPKLMGFFKGSSQPLPPATRMLISANEVIVHYWWIAALTVAAGYILWKQLLQNPATRKAWDGFVWRLPFFGRLVRYRFYAQFARTLGTLLENGLTLLRSLELLEEISGNSFVREQMIGVRLAVMDGAPLSRALAERALFPDLFLDMLSVGEQTGRLPATMHLVAEVHERELNQQIQTVSTLIPPFVMILVASVVGVVVYSIMSAVFSLTQNLRVSVH